MLAFDGSIPGLGDAGAHCTVICDASAPTWMLSYWARDRVCGRRFELPFVVRKLTSACASVLGFADRGVLAAGMKADVNVVDPDRVALRAPRMEYDLPAGGRRLVQDAVGYRATLVDGRAVVRDDEPTGALPGRLI